MADMTALASRVLSGSRSRRRRPTLRQVIAVEGDGEAQKAANEAQAGVVTEGAARVAPIEKGRLGGTAFFNGG